MKCNKRRFWDAALTFFRPGYGLIRVAFGDGTNLSDEDCAQKDRHGNRIDGYLYIMTYAGQPEEGSWKPSFVNKDGELTASGLLFKESDGFQYLFSRKSWPRGDLRDFLPEAFTCMGWPKELKGYILMGYEGQFWDRPDPIGCRKEHRA